ncbi:helix-turn-helix transcriptional regulator [Umezawaea tangerina]|uniref:AraC family transcriptional regulator n=1 Tax=Umezawaea tangerina TaxID=84725 RepID=A0A2T0T1D8_9PSEU|nr:AraC family transcriptional regulator [Umezawaea tangerina]PRY39488.1 AraC family transcriptional regulator [Umezawaea tangerina]
MSSTEQTVPIAAGLPSRVLVDSAGLGWDGVRVRELADPPVADFVLPPVDSLTVLLVTAGSYVVESGAGSGRRHALVSPGTSAVNAPRQEVRARWRSGLGEQFRSVHLVLPAASLAATRDALPRHVRRADPDYLGRDDPFVRETVLELGRAARQGLPALHAGTLAQSITSYLLLADVHDDGGNGGGLGVRALSAVVDAMHERIAEQITLADLAAVAHLSRHHFLRQFTASTRTTPMRYLTSLRMRRARELLRDDTLAVQVVADRCGYRNPTHFTSVFRREHGVTPSRFRVLDT